MINKYLNYVSEKKSQIIIFVLFNLCGLAFILLPYGIEWNMLDLNLSYTSADVFKSFYQMGESGRYINLYSTLILDTIYPILSRIASSKKFTFHIILIIKLPTYSCT